MGGLKAVNQDRFTTFKLLFICDLICQHQICQESSHNTEQSANNTQRERSPSEFQMNFMQIFYLFLHSKLLFHRNPVSAAATKS